MNPKKFCAVTVYSLILVSIVLMAPSISPAYAQAKTHLGGSPADMVILTSDNQTYLDFYPFKRIFPNGDKIDFDAVPAGKVLIITDISFCYSGSGVLGPFIFRLYDIIDLESLYNIVYEYPLTGLRGHKFAFTSGLTFYPFHKINWDFQGEIQERGTVRVYLYGYLCDAPPITRPHRPVVHPPLPPPIDK